MQLHNQLIPLQNLPTLHPDLPTPPRSLPVPPIHPTLPQNHTSPNLLTLPRPPPTAQRHPTPMRPLQSMSSTTTYQTALPLMEERLSHSSAPGRNAAATQPRAPTQSSCLTAELRSSPTLWPTMTAVLSLRCVMRARQPTPQNLPIVILKAPLLTVNHQSTQGRMASSHDLKFAKVQ